MLALARKILTGEDDDEPMEAVFAQAWSTTAGVIAYCASGLLGESHLDPMSGNYCGNKRQNGAILYLHTNPLGSTKDRARHEGLPRYPRRGAMTCAETSGEATGRQRKRTPA